MARFNATKYNPAHDSSVDTDDLRTQSDDEPGYDGVILVQVREGDTAETVGQLIQTCACGCLAAVREGRTFVQGHDQRLRGILTRAHLAGVEVTRMDGSAITSSAMQYAIELDAERTGGKSWAAGLGTAGAAQAAKVAGKLQADAEANTPAIEAAVTDAVEIAVSVEPTGYQAGTVKVGRWVYPARNWDGGVLERNEKRDGSGAWVETTAQFTAV
jgi:hypothetical protein